MPRFDVRYVDPKGFFYPGETIVGNVIIHLDEEIKFRKLTLKFRGKSHCYWSEGTGDDRKSYHNDEEYFKEKIELLSKQPQSNEIRLGPGEFNYPFSYKLPPNLPPTFKAHYHTGYVHYYMKIAFDVDSWRLKSDIEEKIPFKVVPAPTDPNQIRHLLEPAESSKEKFLCCLCCRSGPIRLHCEINQQAFHVGEQIIFSFEIDNKETEKDLRKIEARLVEEVMLISNMTSKERSHKPVSSVLLAHSVEPGGEGSWPNVQLNIPRDIVPTFENCKCVHVSYSFLVEVDIPAAIDAEVKFPVTIISGIHSTQPIQPAPIMAPYGMPSAPPLAGMQHQVYPPPVTTQPPMNMDWIPNQPPPPYTGP